MQTKERYLRGETEDGFTLIELLITVVVIGILASLALPTFGAIQDTARQNVLGQAVKNMVNELAVAQAQGVNLRALSSDGANSNAGFIRNKQPLDTNVYVFGTGHGEYPPCQVAVWFEAKDQAGKIAELEKYGDYLNNSAAMKNAPFQWEAIYYGPALNSDDERNFTLTKDNYADYC